eukprot:scaffold23307_cov101-Isochrysis_galbana.AAC.3
MQIGSRHSFTVKTPRAPEAPALALPLATPASPPPPPPLPPLPPRVLSRAKSDIVASLLTRSPLLEGLDASVVQLLSTLVDVRVLTGGEGEPPLHKAGDEVTHLPMVVQGALVLTPSPAMAVAAAAAGAEARAPGDRAATAAPPSGFPSPPAGLLHGAGNVTDGVELGRPAGQQGTRPRQYTCGTIQHPDHDSSARAPQIGGPQIGGHGAKVGLREGRTAMHCSASAHALPRRAAASARVGGPAALNSEEAACGEVCAQAPIASDDPHGRPAPYTVEVGSPGPLPSSQAYQLSLPHIETAAAAPMGAVVLLLPTRSLGRILRLAPSLRPMVKSRVRPPPPPAPYARRQRAAAETPDTNSAGARVAALEEVGALLTKLTWTRVLAHSALKAHWGTSTAIARAASELHLDDPRPATAMA